MVYLINFCIHKHVNKFLPLACVIDFINVWSFAEHQSGWSWSMKMLITLESHGIFGYNCSYLFKIVQPLEWQGDKAAWRIINVEVCRESQNLFKLKNIQNEIINKNNILKTWYRTFARPAGVHSNHCVSLSVQFAFHTFLLASRPDTD